MKYNIFFKYSAEQKELCGSDYWEWRLLRTAPNCPKNNLKIRIYERAFFKYSAELEELFGNEF